MSQENGRDYFYYSANQHSIQMELMADLVCNFIRQRAETDAGQGHAFSVFIKFFRLQLGVAGIPDKEEVFVFHKAQFLGNGLCFQQLIAVLCPADSFGKRAIEPFFIGCSYLNGYRFAGKEEYKPVIIQTAKSLSTRFRPAAGVLQSWDADKGWQAERGWKCPVIIDNMMNLELLFEASKLSGDSTYYNVAVKHADTTMKNHFRANNSCYHVVDYDPVTGEVRKKQTAQGYADESAWARGQAWAIYGYTMCYRYTHDQKYLDMAEKIYNFIFNNPNLPEDLVPYWDFDAPNIPNEPRDVSAAACTASALYELSTYIPDKNYKETADKIMENLASPAYRAEVGTNGNFILMHSVGSIPHGAEIDVPLNYADYYFLEGIMRKRDLESNKKLF